MTDPSTPASGVTMDPNLQCIMQAFVSGAVQSQASQRDHHVGLMGRLGDNTALDHRLLTGALMSELFSGTTPQALMGYNSASHSPVPQPWIAPGYVAAPQPVSVAPTPPKPA